MSLYIDPNKDKNDDCILGRRYKVEYVVENGNYRTLNSKLMYVAGGYFWFSSKQDGLTLIKQELVNYMYCIDKPIFSKNT